MVEMKDALKAAKKSAFLRHNTVFFFGSLLVGILNYAFYPVIGRLLNATAYGEVQILISIFSQLVIFLTVLSMVTVNVVSTYSDEKKKHLVTIELEKLAFFVSFILIFLGVIFSRQVSEFFKLGSIWPFIAMLLAFLVTVPFTFRNAYLRGHKKFGQVSIMGIIGSSTEILISAVLVIIGLGAVGALLGLVFAQLLGLVLGAYFAYKAGFKENLGLSYFKLPDFKLLAPEVKFSLLVLVSSMFVTVLSTLDVLVIKHYFNPAQAGLYSGVSIIGRSIFLLTASIAAVMLPLINKNKHVSENSNILKNSLVLLFLLGGSALIVFSIFPREIISILMGNKYLVYAHYLPELSIAMFILSVVNMFITYYMALRNYQISFVVILSAILIGGLMIIRHQSIGDIVGNMVLSGIISLGVLGLWLIYRLMQAKGGYAK